MFQVSAASSNFWEISNNIPVFYEKYLVTDKFFFSKLLKSANNVFTVSSFIPSQPAEIQAEVLKDFPD